MSHRLLILRATINLKSEVVPLLQGHDESLFRLTQAGKKKREQVERKEREREREGERKRRKGRDEKKDWGRKKKDIKTAEVVWCLNSNKRLSFFHSYKAETSYSGASKQNFLFLFLHTPLHVCVCVCFFCNTNYGNEMITIMHSSFILMNDDKFYFETFELNFNVVDTISFFFFLFMYIFHYYFWIMSIEEE